MSGVRCLADADESGRSPPVKSEIARGGYAFSHPEWKRPWRNKSQQRNADVIAIKELESESQRQKSTALRRQLDAVQQELRHKESEQNADVTYLMKEKELELKEKDSIIKRLKEEASHRQAALRRQLESLQKLREDERNAKDSEIRELHKEAIRQTEDFSKDAATQSRYHKQEIESMKQVIESKEKELISAEGKFKKELANVIESKDAGATSLLKQLHEADENWRSALDSQQNRSNDLRKQDLMRNSEMETKILSSKDSVATLNRKMTTLERKLVDTETAHTSWTSRITSQIDTMMSSFTSPPPDVTIAPKEKPSQPLDERCWMRVLQLWELIQLTHSEHRILKNKIDDRDSNLAEQTRSEKERWEDRRRDMLSLEREASSLREKQQRLEGACKEVIEHANKMENKEQRLTSRLKFFIDDLKDAEKFRSLPTATTAPRQGLLPIVFVSGHGIPMWSDKVMFRNSMDLLSGTIRVKAHAYAGYEAASKGDEYVFIFGSMSDACEFCIETQIALHETQWPPQLLEHTDIKGTDDMWRGIRCKMSIHCGEVKLQNFGMHRERRYHGNGMIYASSLSAKTAPGQILLSSAAWEIAQHTVDKLRVEVASLGSHTVINSITGNGADSDQLMQMLPIRFASRRFPPIPQSEQHAVGYQESFCDETNTETIAFHQQGNDLRKAIELIASEVEEIGKRIIVVTTKLKNMQRERLWKPEDMVSCFATIDELMLQHDRTRRSLQDLSFQHQTVLKEQRSLETALAVTSEGMASSSEHSREILILKQKHEEQMHALQSQCKSEAQRLLSSIMKRDEAQNRNLALSAIAGSDDMLGVGHFINQHDDGHTTASRRTASNTKRNPRRGTAASWARSRTTIPRTPTRRDVTSPIPLISPSARSKADSFLGMSLP